MVLISRIFTVPTKEAQANSVPGGAVIRRRRALIGITWRKAHVGGLLSQRSMPTAQPWNGL